jgi:DNA-binding NarL/FixJ family response regulator
METEYLPIKIMIAEDQAITLHALTSLLNGYLNLVVIGEAQNGVELLRLLQKDKPDIILMDINMPVLNGFETMRIIDEKMPWVRVIAVSMYDHPIYIKQMIKSGAMGFISKNSSLDELYHAIVDVHNGIVYQPPKVIPFEKAGKSKGKVKAEDNVPDIYSLTSREIEIIQLLADGLLTKEIAKKLYICAKTVEKHKTNILGKLKARSTGQLVKISIEHGLIFH